MPTKTDPARELSDLIRNINVRGDHQLGQGLADLFGVDAWSSEFYQIIFVISSRIDELVAITSILPLDDDQKAETEQGLRTIQQAFGPNGLQNAFLHSQKNYLSPATVAPLSALSGLVRPLRSYPKLDDGERAELLAMIDELLNWLVEHQISENDFIRQALIEGLTNLRFRLERIQWLGWGYTLHGLRDIIAAYFALEKGVLHSETNPPAEAMVKLVNKFVSSFFERAGFTKDVVETGDFMLKAYGTIQLLLAGQTTISGLLTYSGS
ncbi:hypothetical protein BH11PSE5_BH11PSE5_24320 [soil metagenome]